MECMHEPIMTFASAELRRHCRRRPQPRQRQRQCPRACAHAHAHSTHSTHSIYAARVIRCASSALQAYCSTAAPLAPRQRTNYASPSVELNWSAAGGPRLRVPMSGWSLTSWPVRLARRLLGRAELEMAAQKRKQRAAARYSTWLR